MLETPAWLQALLVERAALLINHILYAEPSAVARLQPHVDKLVALRMELPALSWSKTAPASTWTQVLRITAAGLIEPLAVGPHTPEQSVDLNVAVDLRLPSEVAQRMLSGERPAVRIEGEAALAKDVAWLADNLRWDLADELARVLGDAWAHDWAQRAHGLAGGLRSKLLSLMSGRGPSH